MTSLIQVWATSQHSRSAALLKSVEKYQVLLNNTVAETFNIGSKGRHHFPSDSG
jgi:hypothetical protein